MAQDADRYERDLAVELLEAVRTGNIRGVAALLMAGASVDGSPLAGGARPLLLAAASGDARMMHALIGRGADVNAGAFRNSGSGGGGVDGGGGGKRGRGRGKAAAAACPLVEGTRPMHLAVKNGDKRALRLLLGADAGPNLADRNGLTPLMATCTVWNGVAVARELLRAGADPCPADRYGATAVHYAAREAHRDLVPVLLSKGPEALNRLDRGGRTPLCVAAESGRAVTVRRLLSLGATQPRASPPSSERRRGGGIRCPLQAAVRRNHREVVRILVGRGRGAIGGDSSAVPRAMAAAAETGRAKILHVLLEAQEGERIGRREGKSGAPPQRARSGSSVL